MKKFLSRSRLYPVLLIALVFIVWQWRKGDKGTMITLSGTTMGPVVYNIKYFDSEERDFKKEIDSLLDVFNQSLNTYRTESEISTFNRSSEFTFSLPYFLPVLERSRFVFENTKGAFDPTIMPLVNAWGFGPDERALPDSATVDSLRSLVDYNGIYFNEEKVWKENTNMTLDFSAIAKGYGVDIVADYLSDKGVTDYFVEIGGEVIASGTKENGEPWMIGIINPLGDVFNRQLYAKVPLMDVAIATSANNYNYIVKEGRKYVHTISPFSGYPIEHNLLSASVFAGDCMTADAFATAFMVLGLEESIEILEKLPEIDGVLIYQNRNGELQTYVSPDIKLVLIKQTGTAKDE